MFPFNKSKPAAKVNHVDAFDKALADAIANAQKANVSAGTLMARLQGAAEGFRWAAHAESERRNSPAGNPVAVNEASAQREKARLIKAGLWIP